MRPWSTFLSFTTLVLLLDVAAARKCPARHHSLAAGAMQDAVSKNSTNSQLQSFNGCFPSNGFKMPSSVPSSTSGWWCDKNTEYAFMGFSYAVSGCQSRTQMTTEFKDVKNTFGGRYVRLYGACDREGFYNDVVEAAWEAGIGVHALVWFGWDDPNAWRRRRDALFHILHSNPKAKFVTRVVQFGSEPLYDRALEADALAAEVHSAKENLRPLGIPVTISEMAYGFRVRNGANSVMSAIDFIDAHTLPFFDTRASTGGAAWPLVQADLDWFIANGHGKKIYMSQNGWPSIQYSGVSANSPNAISDIANERDYFNMLDNQCNYFKSAPNGGIGWFAHIYSDSQTPGYGIYGVDGRLKFNFHPKSSC